MSIFGRRCGHTRHQRGAAMVEAAIVTPLLLLLVFGIIEFGFLYKDALTVGIGSRAGARVGSAAADTCRSLAIEARTLRNSRVG